MNETLAIVLSVLIVAVVGYPLVVAFDKWKKVMDDVDAETNGEGESNDLE